MKDQVEYLKSHDIRAVALMDDTTTKGIAPDHALLYLFIFLFQLYGRVLIICTLKNVVSQTPFFPLFSRGNVSCKHRSKSFP